MELPTLLRFICCFSVTCLTLLNVLMNDDTDSS